MTHKILKDMGVMRHLPAHAIQRGWEMDLASMRMCAQCGKYLHPKVWNSPCAWTRPEDRIERMGDLALGRVGK